MGVRILENQVAGMAVLYDSVTETCFGPVIRDVETDDSSGYAGAVAEAFLRWLDNYYPEEGRGCDPRTMLPADVVTEYGNFLAEIERDGWEKVTT